MLHTEVFGRADAPTIVLVHGWTESLRFWTRQIQALSEDFRVPDTPAPHWQVVDSKGNTYLLQRLSIKDNGYHRTITLPTYVHDVAKVQIWCAWAETLLGEASFDPPVR